MKKINEYLYSLSVQELVTAYETEYLPFKKTGVCPDGIIRNIATMFKDVSDTYDIRFAERLFLETCSEMFYNQNKKS